MLVEFLREKGKKYAAMREVYKLLQKHDGLTKAELIEKLDIKQTTLVRYLDALMERKLIDIHEYEASSGGRPPAVYAINPDANLLVGIDISRRKTKIVITNLTFEVIESTQFNMTETHHPKMTLEKIEIEIHALLKKQQKKATDILAIGVGSVGPLDREKGIITSRAQFLSEEWEQVEIVDALTKRFDRPVFLENGANTAAVAEYTLGNSLDHNILYCISGIGVRCGVLTDGEITHNQTGDASAIGEMVLFIDKDNPKKLVDFLSFQAILEKVRAYARKSGTMGKRPVSDAKIDALSMEDVFNAVEAGDQQVKNILLESAHYYGVGLSNVVQILHPEKVILSGELIDRYPFYKEKVVESAKAFINPLGRDRVKFDIGELREEASVRGAAIYALQEMIKR